MYTKPPGDGKTPIYGKGPVVFVTTATMDYGNIVIKCYHCIDGTRFVEHEQAVKQERPFQVTSLF